MTAPAKLHPFVGPAAIPADLRAAKRWAPWRAKWNEKKQKYDKIPHRADRPEYGLSTRRPEKWFTFEQALAAYRASNGALAGIGYVMTGGAGLVAADLDHCVENGVPNEWAAEVIAKLDSYTEISPSGTGLRVMLSGDIANDWVNHEVGIEMYGGNEARFLTITGEHLHGSPRTVRAPREGVLAGLERAYAKERRKADVIDLAMPDIDPDKVVDLSDLGLPHQVVDFLYEGLHSGDRSRAVFGAAVALYGAGLGDADVFSVLAQNDHVMEIALDHRRQDSDRALLYIWREQCCKGRARAAELKALDLSAFDDMGLDADRRGAEPGEERPASTPAPSTDPRADEFDDLDSMEADLEALLGAAPAEPSPTSRDLAPVKRHRFQFETVAQFLRRPAPTWIIKGLLPQASLALLFGASGSGKTFFTLDMVASVALGRPWRGLPVAQGGVAYVVAEGAGGFRDRVSAYCRQHDLDEAALPIHILADSPNMMLNPDVKDLGEALRRCGPLSVIVMDTYARVMGGGNENEAQDVNKVVANCALLHKLTGAIVLLVHHTGKDSASGARGSSALRAAADVEVEIVRTKSYRAATVTKMKDGADGGEYRFGLNTIVVGLDEDGEERTSCVVEHLAAPAAADEHADAAKALPPARQRIVDHMNTYLAGEVDRETFIQDLRAVTPVGADGKENPNWKLLITRPLNSLIASGHLVEVSGILSLSKTARN